MKIIVEIQVRVSYTGAWKLCVWTPLSKRETFLCSPSQLQHYNNRTDLQVQPPPQDRTAIIPPLLKLSFPKTSVPGPGPRTERPSHWKLQKFKNPTAAPLREGIFGKNYFNFSHCCPCYSREASIFHGGEEWMFSYHTGQTVTNCKHN